jgi:hypothetical protein
VRKKLQRGAIDLASVAALAVAHNYALGELFCFSEGPRVLRAWPVASRIKDTEGV